MLEIPEAKVVSDQLSKTIVGKTIRRVTANASPHKFAFFTGDPAGYDELFAGREITSAEPLAGQIELTAGDLKLVLSDGVNLRYFAIPEQKPEKHQLRIDFDDLSAVICTVQMYGMIWGFRAGENDNPYYLVAREKPNPLTSAFDSAYFAEILNAAKPNLSIKGVLATEQRIPGLGNGVLQDILFNARINPKSKLAALTDLEKEDLYDSVKHTLRDMTDKGGRDTEKDLFGCSGGYATIMSSKTLNDPCPRCGKAVVRLAYLGGNVYFCPHCQPVKM